MASKKHILVTGGAGYIGSFIVRQLTHDGYDVVIADNLSQGHPKAVADYRLENIDLVSDQDKLTKLFAQTKFAGVIHMASYIQMGESFRDPYKYFHNNLIGAMNLFDVMTKHACTALVFSSSAGVYGTPKSLPIKEDSPKSPENPYGETKLEIENMLHWFDKAHSLKSVAIRYFNAAGAALDGSIGEDHPGESHIIPLIMKAALEKKEFTLFGNDYKTPDKTCVRDYVHVVDLARAHTKALTYLLAGGESTAVNAGTGEGYSNLQIVKEIEQVAGNFAWKFGPRRLGDADALYASIAKIKTILDWQPHYGLRDIIQSAYKWHKTHPTGYGDRP